MLAPDYPLARWRNDPSVDKEKRWYFNFRITQKPFLADLDAPEIEETPGKILTKLNLSIIIY